MGQCSGRAAGPGRLWTRALGLLLVAWLIATPALARQITTAPGVTNAVVVREKPRGAPAKKVGVLAKGQSADLLASIRYYYKVRLANGTVGFVSKRWTDQALAPPAAAALAGGGNLVLHFIDVGQGDSTLVECPNGSTLLIDSGSTSGQPPEEVQGYVADVLDKHGGDLDHLIVSHPDADHYNLLDEVLNDVPIARAWYVGQRSDYSDETVFDWLQTVPAQRSVLGPDFFDREATPNTAINCGAAKVWIMAAAIEATESYKNAMSIVVMIRYGDFEAVITGDATHDTEDTILERYSPGWLQVDLLRIGHHGSEATSTSAAWAAAVRPRVAIASAGYENGYGHPRQEVIARLEPSTEAGAAHGFRSAVKGARGQKRYVFTDVAGYTEAIYATAMSGTITVTTSGTGYALTTER